MSEITVEVPDPEPAPDNDTTVVVVNTPPAPEPEPIVEPSRQPCEHTATVVDLVERVTRLETPVEPVVIVEPEPEPEPVEPDEEPDRTHWWHEPIGNG